MLVCHISFAQIKKIGLTHPIKPSLNTLYTIIKSANIKHIFTPKLFSSLGLQINV